MKWFDDDQTQKLYTSDINQIEIFQSEFQFKI